MPPSTETYVRCPGTSFTVPTRYRVMPAAATMERPGSAVTRTLSGIPAFRQACRTDAAHWAMGGASSPLTYATPRPPPTTSSGRPSGAKNAAKTSMARTKGVRANTWLPRWAWIPTNSTNPRSSSSDSRWTARAAAPDESPNPNFESSCPVRTNSWVCTSTPGVTRANTLGRGGDGTPPWGSTGVGASGISRSRRSISSKESTTMRPTPTARAAASSSSDLLLPWSTSRSAGTPAVRATWSSPPVDTSRHMPSSWASRAMDTHRKALVA